MTAAALSLRCVSVDAAAPGGDAPGPRTPERRRRPRRRPGGPQGARAAARPSVLLVEDDALHRVALHEVLASRGFDVAEASTGEEGLNAARSGRFDVILLDLLLGDLGGLEVLRRLKAGEATRHVPVVVLTAVGTQEDREQALRDGCEAFLRKPPNLAELTSLLGELGARRASALRRIDAPKERPGDER